MRELNIILYGIYDSVVTALILSYFILINFSNVAKCAAHKNQKILCDCIQPECALPKTTTIYSVSKVGTYYLVRTYCICVSCVRLGTGAK